MIKSRIAAKIDIFYNKVVMKPVGKNKIFRFAITTEHVIQSYI